MWIQPFYPVLRIKSGWNSPNQGISLISMRFEDIMMRMCFCWCLILRAPTNTMQELRASWHFERRLVTCLCARALCSLLCECVRVMSHAIVGCADEYIAVCVCLPTDWRSFSLFLVCLVAVADHEVAGIGDARMQMDCAHKERELVELS